MRKTVTLKELRDENNPFPMWELDYDGQKENLSNQICKVIDQIDKIYEETKGNIAITLKLQPNRGYLKNILFGGKPYFDKIQRLAYKINL